MAGVQSCGRPGQTTPEMPPTHSGLLCPQHTSALAGVFADSYYEQQLAARQANALSHQVRSWGAAVDVGVCGCVCRDRSPSETAQLHLPLLIRVPQTHPSTILLSCPCTPFPPTYPSWAPPPPAGPLHTHASAHRPTARAVQHAGKHHGPRWPLHRRLCTRLFAGHHDGAPARCSAARLPGPQCHPQHHPHR